MLNSFVLSFLYVPCSFCGLNLYFDVGEKISVMLEITYIGRFDMVVVGGRAYFSSDGCGSSVTECLLRF